MAETERFQPLREHVDRLKKLAREKTGFDFIDVRWDEGREVEGEWIPGRGCICIFEKDRRGHETVRKELRHPPTDPTARIEVDTEYEEDGEPVVLSVPLPDDHPQYEEKVLGLPRQINEGDVKEVVEHIYGASRRAEMWQKRLEEQRERLAREQEAHRHEYTTETAKELAKVFQAERSGKNPFMDVGAAYEQAESTESAGEDEEHDGFVVRDRRRLGDDDQ